MAVFTTYIFREDFERLKANAAYSTADGGSLYGQWTSTGNPVVHVAITEDGPLKDGIETFLFENYRLCHIGEWRVANDISHQTRQGVLRKYKGRGPDWRLDRGTPPKFVILEVTRGSRGDICPFLFVKQSSQGQGKVEVLAGENPFNRLDVYQMYARPTHGNRVAQVQPTGYQDLRDQRARATQAQHAHTSQNQWYSNPEGERGLRFVFEKMKEVANTEVHMSRDTQTHDMVMSFTSWNSKRWEVKFASDFPRGGALVTDKNKQRTDAAYAHQTSAAIYGSFAQNPCRIPGDTRLESVVTNIIQCIRQGISSY